ncbi:YjiH family protein [Oscillibacter sp. MSJ-2]|uniref:YjiH family protein n=1 Tax=Dysosmobacter acutus TaxID=2841504 RepID=A0ABS6FBT0_9FIRM|nr:YjiH family protein [Dysosmobacter acutus]MBU5627116.1 YjiH family protein [Dysosmobacter acutus]
METTNHYTKKDFLKFLIPSAIGLLFFAVPLYVNGEWTLLYGLCASFLGDVIAPVVDYILIAVICISAVLSVCGTCLHVKKIVDTPTLSELFVTSKLYLVIRLIGALFGVCILLRLGPEMLWGEATGATAWGIVTNIATWFALGVILMPCLTDFGIMDFAGFLFRKFTRLLFHLPGRSTVDLLASWVGCNATGTILTVKQYERGFYTAREAATITTCFSAVSISYSLAIATMVDLQNVFFPFYLSLSFAGIVASFICCRIFPLAKIPNTYYTKESTFSEDLPEHVNALKYATEQAMERARKAPGLGALLKIGVSSYVNIMFTLMPLVVAVGTIALVISEYTTIFEVIATPMGYLLQLLGLEEAFAAAPATLVGFADMFLPAVLLTRVASFETRFVVCGMSLMQVIFLTETGSLILQSKIPLNVGKLFVVFMERTIVGLVVMTLLANLLY